MNLGWLVGGAAVVVGGLFLHGPFHKDGGEEYARPAQQVYAMLDDLSPPDQVEAMLEHVPGATTTREVAPGVVAWRFAVEGTEVARFTTTVTARGDDRSVVSTVLNMTPDADRLLRSKGDASTTPISFAEIAGIAMLEQVDSTLDGRAFDDARVQQATLRYVQRNTADMFQSASAAMDEAVEKSRLEDEADAEAERLSGLRADADKFKPGEPMVQP